MKNIKLILTFSLFVLVAGSCTKLNETFNGNLTSSQVAGAGDAASLLSGVYSSMRGTYQDQGLYFALSEHTTDAMLGPVRGPDWDDNGKWRVLHTHNWDGTNVVIVSTFNALSGTVFNATNMLQPAFGANATQQAEARFLRAVSMFDQLDGWNQVPYREPGENTLVPAKVRVGADAINYIIAELEAIKDILPAAPKTQATKWAARALLMRCYLNKAVFSATERVGPFTFAQADMDKVIAYADEIINSGSFSLAANYFDNFAPDNDTKGKENIWTFENKSDNAGPIRSRYFMTSHYNMNPGGWNGFATLSDYYDKFDPIDKRLGQAYATPKSPANPSGFRNVGFLIGQQYNLDSVNTPLLDRQKAPLSFTREVKNIEVGSDLEVTGIRVYKYPIDQYASGDNWSNDFPYFRLTDIMLMKAEAMLRRATPDPTGALAIVNTIRTHTSRGVPALASLDLAALLNERARELYSEMVRRTDLIRFGKFLEPWQQKPTDSKKYLLFAIPNSQLAVNPNLLPNPSN